MVSQRSPIEELLGASKPTPGGPGFEVAAPPGPGSGGLSPEAARLLTGSPSPAAPGVDETQGAGSPMPMSAMSDPLPPPQAPGPATTPEDNIVGDINDPKDPVNGDVVKDFWSRHGRAPTTVDVQMMHAVPVLEQQLGRPPMRIEVLQLLGARQETPAAGALQFEPDLPVGANPTTVSMGQAPGQTPLLDPAAAPAPEIPAPPPAGKSY